jgi:glycerol-3-phosphate O-acyltransferase
MAERPEQNIDEQADVGRSVSGSDSLSAMTPAFNWPFRWFARRFFRHFDLDEQTVEHLRDLEKQGSVIYVMRYASRLDYFLFNALFLREGLGLSRFANGIRFFYYRPLLQILRLAWARRGELFGEFDIADARSTVVSIVESGESSFLFLRTARIRTQLRTRKRAVEQGKTEMDLLEDIVKSVWEPRSDGTHRCVNLVPLALFWSKGPRSQQRFLNLSYGATTRPSDLAKVTSFLTTYRGLCVKVGNSIDLASFVEDQREEGPYRIARKLRRSILTFLYREEKVVEGPTLRPRHRVQQNVIGTSAVDRAIREWSEEHGASLERGRAEAAKIFREVAANMNSTFLAALNAVVGSVVNRLFTGIELVGIEKIADYAKRHPLVLAPSHRSYFDFLILSIVFYANHLVPPHIAARDNMAFGPFGFLWRRAGAFFLRRSFDDPLYKVVFRTYIAHLIKEGFTQEFFIEGGRSRTGKTLPPRLGMLSWNVDAFLSSARRDMFFVPIAISYERLVEEGAMVDELEGEQKEKESMLALVRARKFLSLRFGSVFINFGEPISLADEIGSRREAFSEETPESEEAKRAFVETLGNKIVERINWAVIPNATSVAACALLGEQRRGLFREELAERMQEIVDLLRLQDVRLTPALGRDQGAYRESIGSMLRSDLIRSERDVRGEVLYYEPARARALDLYRNTIIHYLATPSFLARHLLAGPSPDSLRSELSDWLDLFYYEFFTPRGEMLAAHIDAYTDHFERIGWLERHADALTPTPQGVSGFAFLAELTRGIIEVYYVCAAAVLSLSAEASVPMKELLKSAEDHYQRAERLGEVQRSESANETAFRTALSQFERSAFIELDPEANAKESRYRPGPAIAELTALRQRLARALSDR